MTLTDILEELGNDTPCRALLLCPDNSPIVPIVRRTHLVTTTMARICAADAAGYEWLVSYGYRNILAPEVLAMFEGRAINLHISVLPWNRGADPNLWSWLDDTPKGVTIHQLDAGVDTGPVIAQERVVFASDQGWTLRGTYEALQRNIVELFRETWPRLLRADIGEEHVPRFPQINPGTCHRASDKRRVEHLLTQGWDTPVSALEGYAAEVQMSRECWA